MDEFFEKVKSQQDPFKRLASLIPGFGGYVERQNRRAADKLLRETVARRFDEQWRRTSQIQSDMVSSGMIEYVDDMEKAALQLRTFIDKISHAPYGYSGLFDAIKINESELQAIYQYDAAFFDLADQVAHALDNVEASMVIKKHCPQPFATSPPLHARPWKPITADRKLSLEMENNSEMSLRAPMGEAISSYTMKAG